MKGIPLLVAGILVAGTAFAQTQQTSDPRYDDLIILTQPEDPVSNLPSETLTQRSLRRMMESVAPLSGDQIREVRKRQEEVERAMHAKRQPKAITEIIEVSTRPGEKPVTVKVSEGQITALTIIDSTGQPWPITSAMIGNANNYAISAVAEHQYGNVVTVSPMHLVGNTNLTLMLAGMPMAIPIQIVNSEHSYHPAPVLQIDRDGPNARVLPTVTIDGIMDDDVMKNFVLGIAPQDAVRMQTNDPSVEAWTRGDHLYIRTKYTPVSPLARSYHYGPGGYAAFRLSRVPLLVMATDGGAERRITISDREA